MIRRLALLFAVLWSLVAFAYWLVGPRAPHAASFHPSGDDWQLAQPEFPDANVAWDDLKSRFIWGAPPPPPGVANAGKVEEPPLTPPDWRILAAVNAGADRFVVIQVGKQPPVNVAAGEKLPDGSKLERIEADRLYLVVNGKKRILRIYPE